MDQVVDTIDAPVATEPRSRRKYRNVIGGVILLIALAALMSVLAWKAGWFGASLEPREILRKKLDAPAEVAPVREATAALVAPTEPSPPPVLPVPETATPPASALPAMSAPAPPVSAPTVTTPPSAVKSLKSSVTVPTPAAPRAVTATPPGERFAVEFGPFPTAGEAPNPPPQALPAA